MRILLPLVVLSACSSENEIIATDAVRGVSLPPVPENPVQEDRIVQVVVPVVDILFVVDNSSSMGNEQQALHTNFPQFMEHFVTSGMDYHIGMVSTDMQRAAHSGKLRAARGYRYINDETDDPIGVFEDMTNGLGVLVGSVESGRAAAYTALELIADSSTNTGFLRDEADLHMIFVSDDEDQSGANPIRRSEFIQWATTMKDGAASVQMHGIVAPPNGCGTETAPGLSYIDYAVATNGITQSICAADWGPGLNALGLRTAGLKREFFLTRVPVITPELLLEVQVRTVIEGQAVTLDFELCLAGQEDETCEVVYNPGRNSISFIEYVPDPLAEILLTYKIAENYSAQ
ncbi:MAG: hypothetical protein R3F61_02760 [Myxococcota bacterium]